MISHLVNRSFDDWSFEAGANREKFEKGPKRESSLLQCMESSSYPSIVVFCEKSSILKPEHSARAAHVLAQVYMIRFREQPVLALVRAGFSSKKVSKFSLFSLYVKSSYRPIKGDQSFLC